MSHHPNNDLVAVAWAKLVPGVPSDQVNTTLPDDETTWATSGFVRVTVTGGTPADENALRAPVATFDCWANNPSSTKPPWGKANALAEALVAAHYNHLGGAVTMPSGYGNARVLSTILLSEPRRIPSDPSGFAHFQVDVQILWTES